jgi:hypothetical protein
MKALNNLVAIYNRGHLWLLDIDIRGLGNTWCRDISPKAISLNNNLWPDLFIILHNVGPIFRAKCPVINL